MIHIRRSELRWSRFHSMRTNLSVDLAQTQLCVGNREEYISHRAYCSVVSQKGYAIHFPSRVQQWAHRGFLELDVSAGKCGERVRSERPGTHGRRDWWNVTGECVRCEIKVWIRITTHTLIADYKSSKLKRSFPSWQTEKWTRTKRHSEYVALLSRPSHYREILSRLAFHPQRKEYSREYIIYSRAMHSKKWMPLFIYKWWSM